MSIQVPPDSTGKLVETNSPDGSTQRQVVTVGDSATAAGVAKVQNADPASTDYGMTVRTVAGTAAKPMRVDPTGTTVQPVNGTVTANAGTGTFTDQHSDIETDYDTGAGTQNVTMFGIALPASGGAVAGGTSSNPVQVSVANTGANSTAVKVDGSAVTQPVSGTVTVQQSTAANLKVDLSGTGANATAIKVDGSGVTQPVSGTVTANIGTAGTLALDASVTGLQVAQASTTSGQKGSLAQGAVTTNAPTYTTAQTDPLSLDTSGNLRVSLKDTPQNTNALKVDGSAVTQPVSGTVTVGNATLAVTESGTWTVQPGNTANTTPWLVQDVGQATGGMSFFTQSLTSTKAQVKGSGGTVYGITAVNNGSTLAYIQVFNKLSANVTVGTTAPDYVVPVPAPSSGTAGAGIREEYGKGLAFGTGITVACTTTRTGSTSATCDVNVNYI